jgi:hypothetical protein
VSSAVAVQTERALKLIVGSYRKLSDVEFHRDAPADRRSSARRTLSDLSWLRRVRLKYGPCVSLIDLSVGGIQLETADYPLLPGGTVVLEMETARETLTVPSSVMRACVSGLSPTITYRSSLSFRRAIAFPDVQRDNDATTAPATLLHDHAKLSLALRVLDDSPFLSGTHPQRVGGFAQSALAASLAVMESPSGRGAVAEFSREMSRLLQLLHRGIITGASPEAILAELVEALRRVVPAHAIRIAPAGAIAGTSDAVCFGVPSPDGKSAGRLVVEFAREGRLEAWHLSFLKAAAHLVAVVNQVELLTSVQGDSPESVTTNVLPAGWKRLVVRYPDGRVLKGYNTDFVPARGHVHVWMKPEGPDTSRITVSLGHLKALFFVHDLAGDPSHLVRHRADTPTEPGRRVDITFLDGETLAGTTLNYSAKAVGFFVAPVASRGNNLQIFAIAKAVLHVKFP